MRKEKLFLLIGILMLLIAMIFILVALNHPEMSFPWSNTVTYIIYGIYVIIMILMFAMSKK